MVLGLSLVIGTPSAEATCDTECPAGTSDSNYYYPDGHRDEGNSNNHHGNHDAVFADHPDRNGDHDGDGDHDCDRDHDGDGVRPHHGDRPDDGDCSDDGDQHRDVTDSGDGDGHRRWRSGRIATSTENVTDRVTETENVFATQQTTEHATTTVSVTRWNATVVNTQTGKTPAVTTTASQVSPGGVLTLSGDGYTPGESIQIVLHSDPVLLETVNADANGQFQTAVTIPIDTPVGAAHDQRGRRDLRHRDGRAVDRGRAGSRRYAGDVPADPVDTLWSATGTRTLSYTGVNTATAGTVAALLIGTGTCAGHRDASSHGNGRRLAERWTTPRLEH